MKRSICIILALAMIFALAGCGMQEKAAEQDTSPITMLVALGNGEKYYKALGEKIESELGIDIEFVYQISCNTSDMQKLYFANNDLPADIVFTSSKTDSSLLKDSCVDLLSRLSVTALFTPTTLQGCTTAEGAVYQLPISSKLIGITYNETLLKEMGREVPENFEDMLELKAACDEAGIKFAVSDGIATGHGFNWLFHLMGSQWLSTPEGTAWFEGFQAGAETVDKFKEQCEYFKKWTEAGLWGSIRTQDWGGAGEFSTTRALFWFGLTNSMNGYEGPQLDENGNETGVMLKDTYKSIPWISEDGSNNCYTYYDNCWIYVNKELEAADKSDKLEKALKIVEFMTSESATSLVSGIASDTYVSVNNYQMGDDRIYARYNESVKNGFVQPWYYNSFDANSIEFTGAAVNAYMRGEGSFDEIFKILDETNQQKLNAQTTVLADFPEGLDYENTAKLFALTAATAMDMSFEENGRSERIDVAIAPYTPGPNLLQPWKHGAVCNSIVYPGELDAAMSNCIFAAETNAPCCIRMTGAEIKAIVEKGFDPSDLNIDAATGESTFDSEHYGPYPYVCLVRNGAELEDGKEYLVALCEKNITAAEYSAFSDAGRIITDLENIKDLKAGLRAFAAEHPQITADDLVF